MELRFALLADHITETRDGKLVLIGEFDGLMLSDLQKPFPRLSLVARFEADDAEGSDHRLQIGCFDDDGSAVLPLSPELHLRFHPLGPGRGSRGQVIMNFDHVLFPRYGEYSFRLLVDGHLAGRVPLHVSSPPRPSGVLH